MRKRIRGRGGSEEVKILTDADGKLYEEQAERECMSDSSESTNQPT